MTSSTVRIGWWSSAGAGRLEVPLDREFALRKRLIEQGAVVWREGLAVAKA